MAEHGQPDIVGAAGTAQPGSAQAGTAQAEVAASPHGTVDLTAEAPPVHHGRPVSWAAVTIILIGFIIGGAALMFGPTWWLFWVGCAVTAFGGFVALAGGIFNDWY
jgi:hypothetical protein